MKPILLVIVGAALMLIFPGKSKQNTTAFAKNKNSLQKAVANSYKEVKLPECTFAIQMHW